MTYEDPEKQRAWYAANRDKVNANNRRYRERNQDKVRKRERERAREKRLAAGATPRPGGHIEARLAADWSPGAGRYRDPNYHANYYQQNRDKSYVNWLWAAHGMRPEDWTALWNAQDGRCYLCSGEMEKPDGPRSVGIGSATVVIDHDHSCCPPNKTCRICRRGLAHSLCNQTIGLAGDSPERLRHMADALESALLAVAERKAQAGAPLALF